MPLCLWAHLGGTEIEGPINYSVAELTTSSCAGNRSVVEKVVETSNYQAKKLTRGTQVKRVQ